MHSSPQLAARIASRIATLTILGLVFLLGCSVRVADAQETAARATASLHGTIVDRTGAFVGGAKITLVGNATPSERNTITDERGEFSFSGLVAGPFQLKVSAAGFASQSVTGVLQAGQDLAVPQITLNLPTENIEIRVTPTNVDIAEDQIKVQEKQRVLGVIPNYYVTYVADAAPLNTKQKFELAWKTSVDPISFGMVGVIAGVQQAQNTFSGYGQGAAGYGRRYGASYGNFVTGTFFGSAVFPSLFKQDPRYFYKGTGSKRSRIARALASSVICKGDNGKWQANYSGIMGSLAAGGISNLYYPEKDRNGAALAFQNALIGIGETAAANLLQEFLIPKLTPNAVGHHSQPTP